MIHFDPILNLWQFDQPNHNVNNGSTKQLIYNQWFGGDKLYLHYQFGVKSGLVSPERYLK
jgi:hypothetical protein